MRKIAVAILFSAGAAISVGVQAYDRTIIGAVDGALVGGYFGGSNGAVAGAILGAVVGGSSDNYYDRRGYTGYERGYRRYEPAPGYYEPRVSYQSYYEPRYDPYCEPRYEPQYPPRRVVYVELPRYQHSQVIYAGYGVPVYAGRYGSPGQRYYAPRHDHNDYRGRY